MSKKHKINKNVINIIIVLLMFIALFGYMIIVDGLDNMLNIIKNIDPMWAIIGVLLIILYWLIESLVLNIITKKVYKNEDFIDSLQVTMIGQLFNNITPFSSGGQPMQAITMVKNGVSITSSVSILLIKFIIYQASLVIYTSIIMIFKYVYFKEIVTGFVSLSIIGFVINFAVIVFLIMVGINKKFVYGILKTIYKYLDKIGLLKNSQQKLEKLRTDMDKFHEEFKVIKKEKIMIFKTMILTIIQLTAFSTITYAVYRAFGHNSESIINIISAQTFLMMIMAFIPTPGAGGAAEGGFFVIFKTFFAVNEIKMAILFWRIYTFYLPILVGGLFLILKHRKNNYHSIL
ncbi:MAG: lysylphosphatidylglycerol synthase transmembrane domain-containing protein [Clostridia bacterium]